MTTEQSHTADTRAVEELIIDRARLSYARLPMLEVVFDRFALSLVPVLKAYLGAMVDVSLDKIEYMSCADATEDLPNPALIAVTEAEGWAGPFAVTLKPDLLFAAIEITFGGRTVPVRERSSRSFTAIEKRVGEKLCDVALAELATAFAKVTPVKFEISHIETNPRALLLGPPASACVRARLRIEAEDREGEMIFVLPNTAFEPVNDVLSQNFQGGTLGGDTGWRTKMTGMLETTNVTLNAVMTETEVSLKEVLAWTPGTVLDFGMQAQDPVMLCCSGKAIALAEVGKRRNGRVALKLSEQLIEDEELSHVLGH
ncbi:hypothetical protein ATO6_20420 [Oceanicola sp. 22II-s10i]|uniref:flagellar motor switch protein FliM n=1 Tax=Oceanicola sp. 22II-s10i TaxID=1317116 RepID=UPI000B5250C6|nr:FliM/FliN family flagellar motor switch protein [Oceanicola sp. 22II-s10i]OWU83204.1 hypothetical protein ATO6_20420 [Oceanicola sp. 22II-s10i]